uniref:Uncharacterized protein n=1 Tax=Cannabis sativa TaxID=3483 RepID=A0A803RC41_CANSA
MMNLRRICRLFLWFLRFDWKKDEVGNRETTPYYVAFCTADEERWRLTTWRPYTSLIFPIKRRELFCGLFCV